jgi:hypothetical protein
MPASARSSLAPHPTSTRESPSISSDTLLVPCPSLPARLTTMRSTGQLRCRARVPVTHSDCHVEGLLHGCIRRIYQPDLVALVEAQGEDIALDRGTRLEDECVLQYKSGICGKTEERIPCRTLSWTGRSIPQDANRSRRERARYARVTGEKAQPRTIGPSLPYELRSHTGCVQDTYMGCPSASTPTKHDHTLSAPEPREPRPA